MLFVVGSHQEMPNNLFLIIAPTAFGGMRPQDAMHMSPGLGEDSHVLGTWRGVIESHQWCGKHVRGKKCLQL